MNKIEYIIIHCSDSEWGCSREIRKWHLQNGWKDIGYQFVILNGHILPKYFLSHLNGMVECGRYLDEDLYIEQEEIGAHTLGYNKNSIGICLIGKKLAVADRVNTNRVTTFTTEQMVSLIELVKELIDIYKINPVNVIGHCETESGKAQGKTCPDFNIKLVRDELMI